MGGRSFAGRVARAAAGLGLALSCVSAWAGDVASGCGPASVARTPPRVRAPAPVPPPAGVVNLCAPVVTVGAMPQGPGWVVEAVAASAAPARGGEPNPPLRPASASIHAPASVPASSPAEARAEATEFHIKLEHLLDAEFKSSDRVFMYTCMGVFLALLVLVVGMHYFGKKRHDEGMSRATAVVGVLLVLAAAGVFGAWLLRPVPARDVAVADMAAALAAPRTVAPAPDATGDPRLAAGLEALGAAVDRLDAHLAAARADVPQAIPGSRVPREGVTSIGVLCALVALSIGLLLGVSAPAVASSPGRDGALPFAAWRERHALPLDALYVFEDRLAELRIAINHWPTWVPPAESKDVTGESPPEVRVDGFLVALDGLRRRLEDGPAFDHTPHASGARGRRYRLKTDLDRSDFFLSGLALDSLADVLAARHGRRPAAWRVEALRSLAEARQAVLKVCEPADESS